MPRIKYYRQSVHTDASATQSSKGFPMEIEVEGNIKEVRLRLEIDSKQINLGLHAEQARRLAYTLLAEAEEVFTGL